jgi:hypothetical protein
MSLLMLPKGPLPKTTGEWARELKMRYPFIVEQDARGVLYEETNARLEMHQWHLAQRQVENEAGEAVLAWIEGTIIGEFGPASPSMADLAIFVAGQRPASVWAYFVGRHAADVASKAAIVESK